MCIQLKEKDELNDSTIKSIESSMIQCFEATQKSSLQVNKLAKLLVTPEPDSKKSHDSTSTKKAKVVNKVKSFLWHLFGKAVVIDPKDPKINDWFVEMGFTDVQRNQALLGNSKGYLNVLIDTLLADAPSTSK